MEHDSESLVERYLSWWPGFSFTGRKGFSLLELLIVLSIVALLSAVMAPSIMSAMSSSRLNSGADDVVGLVGNARQAAIALNRIVEIRFYQFSNDSGANCFRAMQAFQADANGNTSIPLTKIHMLPAGIIIDSGAALSPLLGRAKVFTVSDPKINLPRVGTAYNCAAFQISPGGLMTLPFQSWYMTLHAAQAGDGLSSAPANFAAIRIDPASGVLKVYRP